MRIIQLLLATLITAHANPVTLGPLANPGNFNRTSFSGTIDYGINLNTQTYHVRLPANYDPAKTYGLVSFIDWVNPGGAPATAWQAVLDRHDLIWVGGVNIGNSTGTTTRFGAAIMGAFRMTELHKIDPNRVYSVGTSGGAQLASELVFMRRDFFKGFIGLAGTSMPTIWQTSATPWTIIPGWAPPGRLDNTSTFDDDGTDYGWAEWTYGSALNPAYSIFPPNYRFAIITNEADFRRTEITGIYRYFYMNFGNRAKLIVRPGGHAVYESSSFEEAVRFMMAAETKVIHDRFEDANLSANTDPANTLERGNGFWNRSAAGASASEVNYSYNSKTQKVLRLTPGPSGAAAVVEAKNRFRWTTPDGITLDAKLRAETQNGNNQQVGLHIARGNSDDTPEDNPGLHVYANYATGVKNRIVFVKADGTLVELAKWDHAGTTHPMAMGTGDKLFWYAPLGTEHSAKTLDFRGEDIRIVANNDGFQLTFARPAANLETDFPGKVMLAASPATLTSGPNSGASDGEDHRIVLQGRWADLNLASAVSAVDFRHWKLMISNRAVNPAASAGDALVDEVALWADQEEMNFTGPVITTPGTLTVNATSGQGALVPFSVSAMDDVDGAVPVTNSRASGSGFPIGTTMVACEAVDSHGNRTAAEFAVTVLANGFVPTPPPVPAAPTASGAVGRVALSWVFTNYASSHSVYRSLSAGGPFTLVQAGIAGSSFVDTGLTSGTTYFYRLSASNAAGESGLSSVLSATPPSGTAIKANNTFDLSDAGSWVDGGRPGPLDTARWDQTVTGSNSSAIGSGLSVAGIEVTNPNGDVAIASGGGGSLTIGASGVHAGATTAALTISAPVSLNGNQTWTTGATDTSTQITVGAVISGSGGISLATGATRGISLNAANSFTGGFTLNPGNTVVVGNVNASGSGGNLGTNQLGRGILTINGGTFTGGNGGLNQGIAHTQIQVNADFAASFTARTILAGAWNLGGATRTASTSRTFGAGTAIGAGSNTSWGIGTVGSVPTTLANGRLRVARAAGASNFVCFRIADNPGFPNNAGLTVGSGVISVIGNANLAKSDKTQLMALEIESGGYFGLCESSTTRSAEIASITGGGEIGNYNTATSSGTANLTIHGGVSTGRHVFSGRIVNTNTALNAGSSLGIVNLIKDGSTTQVLAGTNLYTGTTSVNGGTLFVNGSLASPANLTVAAAATLGGSGSIVSPVTVNGTLAPGDGPGTLTLTGSLAMSASSKLQWQLAANSSSGGDFLNAAAVTIASGAKLDLVFNSQGSLVSFADPFWQSNRSWALLSATSLGGGFTLDSVSNDAAGRAAAAYGSFGLQQNATSVSLVWTAFTALERWRYANFGSAANSGNGADSADPDGDGLNNLGEFQAGTDPNDPASPFRTFVWTSTESGEWMDGTKWNSNTAPVSGAGTRIEFLTGNAALPAGPVIATNNHPGNFLLHSLRLAGTGSGPAAVTLSGGPLEFRPSGATPPQVELAAFPASVAYTINNPLVLAGDTNLNAVGDGRYLFAGVISGPGGLVRTGTQGTIILAGDNTYQGATTVPPGGVIQIGNDGAAGAPGSGPIINQGTLRIDRSGMLELPNSISGGGSLTIDNPAAADALVLSGQSTFSGNLVVNRGTLRLTRADAGGLGPKTIFLQGVDRRLQLSGGFTLPSNFTLIASTNSGDGSGISNVDGNNRINGPIQISTGNGVLNISSMAGALTLAGNVTAITTGRSLILGGSSTAANTVTGSIGNGSTVDMPVTKQGAGTWILANTHSYTGPTAVNAGRLVLAGSLASNLNVVAGTLAAAGAAGTTGSMTLNAGGRFEATTGSTMSVGGSVTLAGNLDLIAPPGLAQGDVFTLISKTAAGAVNGNFAGLPEGALFVASGYSWRITYAGGDGNDVAVTIPILSAIESWRQTHFGVPSDSGDASDGADPDSDGETNLLEFATGQAPLSGIRAVTTLVPGGGGFEFTYTRSKVALADGYQFIVEHSDTLAAPWTAAGPGSRVGETASAETVAVAIPESPANQRFVRLRVVAP